MTELADVSHKLNESALLMERIQAIVHLIYGEYDRDKSLLWLMEEVGELTAAIRKGKTIDDIKGEMGDVLAWVLCMINILGFDGAEILRGSLFKEASRQMTHYGHLKYWANDAQ